MLLGESVALRRSLLEQRVVAVQRPQCPSCIAGLTRKGWAYLESSNAACHEGLRQTEVQARCARPSWHSAHSPFLPTPPRVFVDPSSFSL